MMFMHAENCLSFGGDDEVGSIGLKETLAKVPKACCVAWPVILSQVVGFSVCRSRRRSPVGCTGGGTATSPNRPEQVS